MKFITKDFGNLEYAYILPLGDMHIGDPAFDEKKFVALCNWILEEPNAYVVLVGDILNCATKNSKSDIYGEEMNPQQAKKKAVELLLPIKDRILCMVAGNHEFRIYRESGTDIAEDVADRLGIPYHIDGILLNMKFDPYPELRTGKKNYTAYITHGMGGGGTKGAKVNAVSKLANIVLADLYLIGHIHFMTSFKDSFFIPDTRNGKIDKVTRTFVSAGSFLSWGGYAERMSLPPAKLGTPRIRLAGSGKKDCHVSI
jgi:predicted phosphodiesterase